MRGGGGVFGSFELWEGLERCRKGEGGRTWWETGELLVWWFGEGGSCLGIRKLGCHLERRGLRLLNGGEEVLMSEER